MPGFVYLICASCFAFLIQTQEASQRVTFSLRETLSHSSWPGLVVIIVLLLMSIYSIAIMLERFLTFQAAAKQSRQFVPQVSSRLRSAQISEAMELTRTFRRSHLAVVLNSGLQEIVSTGGSSDRRLRKAKRALKRASAIKSAELRRGLSGLATIGSTAPFVGLFGTVVGIIECFQTMNTEQTTGFGAVSGGISEALIATAFGLVVAIPAVWMFNYFTNRVHVFEIEMRNSGEELIDFFLQRQEAGKD